MADTAKVPRSDVKVRGVYEHPSGSKIWWINYYAPDGRHRERVGRKSDAVDLYRIRKAAIRSGEKLPELRKRVVTLGELMDDAVEFARIHNRSASDYLQKSERCKPKLGALAAASVPAETLSAWIDKRKVSPATYNRYKAFFSLCYREGIRSRKVNENPAKLMRRRREPTGRKRFLSRDEYTSVLTKILEIPKGEKQATPAGDRAAVARRTSAAAFIISVHTGMRLGEQYTLEWRQVDFERNEINLTKTKNGDDRTIPMVRVVREELLHLHTTLKPKRSSRVFPRPRDGKGKIYKLPWFTEAIDAAKIDDYTWHNNRHTFCSWLAITRTPLKTIQVLAGHKTISITARYAHLFPDDTVADMERMASRPGPTLLEKPTAIKTAIGSI